MTPASPVPAPTASAPSRRPRRGVLAVLACAAMLLLVLGLVLGGGAAFLALRPERTTGDTDNPVTVDTSSPSVSDGSPSDGPAPTPPPETTPTALRPPEEGTWCWMPERSRVSRNPTGKLRGGGLDLIPPASFSNRQSHTVWAFTTDAQQITAEAEKNWVSSITVGRLVWEPGVQYPGSAAASTRLLDCMVAAPVWRDATNRRAEDVVTEPVTIDGVRGHRTTAAIRFDSPTVTSSESLVTVIVLETEGGPSMVATEIAGGHEDHAAAAEQAIASLTAVR